MERRESENGLPLNRPLAPAARAPSLTATQSMRACDACSQPAPAGTIKPALNGFVDVSESGWLYRTDDGAFIPRNSDFIMTSLKSGAVSQGLY